MNKVKSIFITILSVFLLYSISFGASPIKSDIRVSMDGAGDYVLTSISQELYDSRSFIDRDRFGMSSCVFICRRNGKWDKEFLIASKWPSNAPLLENAKKHLQTFMNLCDEVIPNEKILSICYYADYKEVFIYLHRDQLKNKKIHEEVAKKLNNALHKD
jgi:hypothetical protein